MVNWAGELRDLVEGFKAGYELVESPDEREERRATTRYRQAAAQALELENDPENWRLRQEALRVETDARRAGTALTVEQTKAAEYGNTPEARALESRRVGASSGYQEALTGQAGATTEAQQLENQRLREQAERRKAMMDAINRRLGIKTSTPGPQSALPEDERDLLARIIVGEAAGEGPEGMQAVANVALNRARSGRYGSSLKDVLTAKNQFEPWSTRRNELLSYDPNSPQMQEAFAAIDAATQGDITGGATHFLNPETVRKRRGGSLPKWATNETLTIGGHTFYAPEGSVADGSVGADRYAPTALALPVGNTMSDTDVPELIQVGHEAAREGVKYALAQHGLDDDQQEAVPTPEQEARIEDYYNGHGADEETAMGVQDLHDAVKDKMPKGASEAQVLFTTLAVARMEKLMEGDVEGANRISGAIIQNYKVNFNNYQTMAKLALEDGDLPEATKMWLKAYSYVPDGMEIDVKKKGDDFVVVQKDMGTGKVVGEERVMPPEEMVGIIMGTNMADFEAALVSAASQREALTAQETALVNEATRRGVMPEIPEGTSPEAVRLAQAAVDDARKGAGGGDVKWGDVNEQLDDIIGEGVEKGILPKLDERGGDYERVKSVAGSLAGPTGMNPRVAVLAVIDAASPGDEQSPATERVPLEGGGAIYNTEYGPIEVDQIDDRHIIALRGKIKKANDQNSKAPWYTQGHQGGTRAMTGQQIQAIPVTPGPEGNIPPPPTGPGAALPVLDPNVIYGLGGTGY